MKTTKITIGSDHAGYGLKLKVIAHLKELGIEVLDVGTDSEASCDYPVFAHRVCKNIQDGVTELGILVCGTGVGMSIAANKHRGIRAAVCSDTFSARLTRQHNDANVLCFGERVVGAGVRSGRRLPRRGIRGRQTRAAGGYDPRDRRGRTVNCKL